MDLLASDLSNHIDWVLNSHFPVTRKWDLKTPYGIHPVWCAMTILTEEKLSESVRFNGSLALLYHDILEDTDKLLPKKLGGKVMRLIKEMTFNDFEDEKRRLYERSKNVWLLKMYDKVSNLLDSGWMLKEDREDYYRFSNQLAFVVKDIYGDLNIIKIFKSLSI